METLVTFSVDDTSPCISYSPFPDTFSTPNLTAGWNPYFTGSGFATSQGSAGEGTSQHITSLDGASLALQWRGTGITLMGNATRANYTVMVDGQNFSPVFSSLAPNVLASIQGLDDTQHNTTLTAVIPPQGSNLPNSPMLVFDQATIFSSPVPSSANIGLSNSTLNDTDIAFSGLWSIEELGGSPLFHTSNSTGDKAFTTFNGTTLLVLGRTSPDAGNYTVTLDGNNATSTITQTLSAKSSFTQENSLLFFASDLDPTVSHSVQMVNEGGDLALLIGGFKAFIPFNQTQTSAPNSTTTTPSSTSSNSTTFEEGTVAAFVLAGLLGFLLITAALYFFLVYRPRRRRRRAPSTLTFARTKKQDVNAIAARRQSAKEQEAIGAAHMPGVLNIGPGFDDKDTDLEADNAGAVPESRPRRFSALSDGFQRWRREAVRGSLGGLSLGIRFRHSESPATTAHGYTGDTGNENRDGSDQRSGSESSWTESTSAARRREEKRLGKMRQITGRSWSRSPSFTVDLNNGNGENNRYSQRYSQRYSRRQSLRTSDYLSASAATAAVGAAVAGAAAGRLVSTDRSSTFYAANAPPLPVRPLPRHPYQYQQPEPAPKPQRQSTVEETAEPPSYAASVLSNPSNPSNPSNSISNSQSDPSSFQVPLSVSPSPVTTTYPRVHYRDSSNGFLLHDVDSEEGGSELPASDLPDDGHSPRRTSTRRVHYDLPSPTVAEATRRSERYSTQTTGDNSSHMREVIRTLSPRTSTAPRQLPVPPGRSQPRSLDVAGPRSPQSPETDSPASATSPTSRPLLPLKDTAASNRAIKALPRTPTSEMDRSEDDNKVDLPTGFLSVRETSPFRVDFDSSSIRPGVRPLPSPTTAGQGGNSAQSAKSSTEPDLYFTPSTNSSTSNPRSSSSNIRGSVSTTSNRSQRDTVEFQQSPSRLPFRLTPMTFPTSSAVPSISSPEPPSPTPDQSPANSEGVTSFLDFTSSREPSFSAPSDRKTHSRNLPQPPPISQEPSSRWSTTTVPSIITNLGAGASMHSPANDSSGELHVGDQQGGRETLSSTASSTFPIPFEANVPPSPHHIMDNVPTMLDTTVAGVPSRSARTSATQQSSHDLHVHPVLEDMDSPTESIPMTVSTDIQFEHNLSEMDPDSRPVTQHGASISPANAAEDEYRPRPFDPSLLVSRVLGLPSPSSMSTIRPPPSRSASATAASSSQPSLPTRTDPNSSNDRVNPGRQGPPS